MLMEREHGHICLKTKQLKKHFYEEYNWRSLTTSRVLKVLKYKQK